MSDSGTRKPPGSTSVTFPDTYPKAAYEAAFAAIARRLADRYRRGVSVVRYDAADPGTSFVTAVVHGRRWSDPPTRSELHSRKSLHALLGTRTGDDGVDRVFLVTDPPEHSSSEVALIEAASSRGNMTLILHAKPTRRVAQ